MSAGFIWLSALSSYVTLLTLTSMSVFSNWLLTSLLFFKVQGPLRTSHTLLVVLLITNLIVFDVVTYRWIIITDALSFHLDITTLFSSSSEVVLDNTALEVCKVSSTMTAPVDTSWNIATVTNTPSLNFFSLLSANDLFCNLYNLATTYAEISLFIELPLIPVLNLMFWGVLSITWTYSLLRVTSSSF